MTATVDTVRERAAEPEVATEAPEPEPAPRRRLASLDVLRGAAIVGMVLVNNNGSYDHQAPQLEHALWHGVTVADVVFPAFLVAAGAALPFALAGRRLDLRLSGRLLRRAGVLLVLGLLLNFQREPSLADVRIPGILQRIAVATLVAAFVVVLVPRWGWLVAAALLLVGHAFLLGGELGPPGDATAAGRLDVAAFGVEHLYVNAPFDPEGLLGTLSSIATVLLAAWGGSLLLRRDDPRPWRGTVAVAELGAGLVAAGLLWAVFLPLNKALWTPSYAVFTAGVALLALAALHLSVDVARAPWLGFPLALIGENALIVYVGTAAVFHVLRTTVRDAWYAEWFAPAFGEVGGSYAFALVLLAVFWVLALALRLLGVRVRA